MTTPKHNPSADEGMAAENAKLREKVEMLTNAYAEAVVIIAKWSPGGLDQLSAFLGKDAAASSHGGM